MSNGGPGSDPRAVGQREPTRTRRQVSPLVDEAIDAAMRRWREGDLDSATVHIERALALLEQAGLRYRLGATYKLHAMVFISRDRASLALAAAMRALGYPDLCASDRMYLFATVAMALHQIVDLPSGGQVMLERAWPEAQRAGDAKTMVDCASRCAGLLHDCACWALGIPNLNLLGTDSAAPEAAAAYLERAARFIALCDERRAELSDADVSWYLGQKGCVVSLAEGFDAALPIFLEAQRLAAEHPRLAMMSEMTTGIAARIAGRWDVARDHLLRSRARESAQSDHTRRFIAWELSHVDQALGQAESALDELRRFDVLQARKSRLSKEWIGDIANVQRYGERLAPDTLQKALVGAAEPPPVTRAIAFIEQHLANRLTVHDVANHAFVSKRTLQLLFERHRRISVSAFIRERRMQRADEALRRGVHRIAEVAELSGYSNAANFSRDYRQRFGRSPSSMLRLAGGLPRSRSEAAT